MPKQFLCFFGAHHPNSTPPVPLHAISFFGFFQKPKKGCRYIGAIIDLLGLQDVICWRLSVICRCEAIQHNNAKAIPKDFINYF